MDLIGQTVRIKTTGETGVVFQEIDTKRQGASGANWWVKLPDMKGSRACYTAELEKVNK